MKITDIDISFVVKKKKCKRRIKVRELLKILNVEIVSKQFWLSPNDWLVPSVSLTSLWPQILFKCTCNRKFGKISSPCSCRSTVWVFSCLFSAPRGRLFELLYPGLASRNTDKIEDWEGKKLSMCSDLWQEVALFLHIHRCCCVAFLYAITLAAELGVYFLVSFFSFLLVLAS